MHNPLFNRATIYNVIESQKQSVKQAVDTLAANYLLNVSEEDLVGSLVAQFRLDVPTLKEEAIHVADYGEAQVDVSSDPSRYISDRSRPFNIPGTKMMIAVPFEGDAGFFDVQPQTYSLNPPFGTIVGNELHLSYVRTDHDADAVKRDYVATVGQIKGYLDTLRVSAKEFNDQLDSLVRQIVVNRKQKLL